MEKLIEEYETTDLGVQHPQYFSGFGVEDTDFSEAFIGIGSSAYEAADDALEQASMAGYNVAGIDSGVMADFSSEEDRTVDAEGEMVHYVGLRLSELSEAQSEAEEVEPEVAVVPVASKVADAGMSKLVQELTTDCWNALSLGTAIPSECSSEGEFSWIWDIIEGSESLEIALRDALRHLAESEEPAKSAASDEEDNWGLGWEMADDDFWEESGRPGLGEEVIALVELLNEKLKSLGTPDVRDYHAQGVQHNLINDIVSLSETVKRMWETGKSPSGLDKDLDFYADRWDIPRGSIRVSETLKQSSGCCGGDCSGDCGGGDCSCKSADKGTVMDIMVKVYNIYRRENGHVRDVGLGSLEEALGYMWDTSGPRLIDDEDTPGAKLVGHSPLETHLYLDGKLVYVGRPDNMARDFDVSEKSKWVKEGVNFFMSKKISSQGKTAELSIEGRELLLYIENNAQLYSQQQVPIQKNLARKKMRGVYDPEKAVKLWMYLVEAGAKKYVQEFDAPGAKWFNVFSKPDRVSVATEMARGFEQDMEYSGPEAFL